MARIIAGSYMVRYPLGGNLSWALQWLVGLHELGHEVFSVERANYPHACYDPQSRSMGDDPGYGIATVRDLLTRHGLEDRWCYVDAQGDCFGMSRAAINEVFQGADLFLDLGTHGAWLEEAAGCGLRVLVDGEPGYRQIKFEETIASGGTLDFYDHYYSNGANIGTAASTAPDAGLAWRHVFNPVVTELFTVDEPPPGAAFTTVMNWQAHDPVEYQNRIYGQKDIEFARFMHLPGQVSAPMEVAASGKSVPRRELAAAGWRVCDGEEVTVTFDDYRRYLAQSLGEFSVGKNVFVAMRTGWFSDRSAAYLASGRPVVLQDTGFSEHLPCGEGLFAVDTPDQAAAAIEAISSDYNRHSRAAREVAREHLATDRVLKSLLNELDI